MTSSNMSTVKPCCHRGFTDFQAITAQKQSSRTHYIILYIFQAEMSTLLVIFNKQHSDKVKSEIDILQNVCHNKPYQIGSTIECKVTGEFIVLTLTHR